MSPVIRSVRSAALGLALAVAALAGPLGVSTASASALAGIAPFEEPPPPPDPVPVIDRPSNPGPGVNNEAPQLRPRRHHGDPVMGR
jgi:hypothetical protein